jgi:phosphoribosylanthranilate isomerase
MIIKVCGMRDSRNIRDVEALHPDMMGFMFWPGSKRYVSCKPDYLPNLCRVGVFVNPEPEYVKEKAQEYCLDRIQLHGTETPKFCSTVRLITGLPIIKAIQVASAADFEQCAQYEYDTSVDMFLFDTKCSGWGGSGQEFDWSLLDNYKGSKPFLLAGGIGSGMEDRIHAIHHPQFCGIDLNSRFETEPALKEITKLSLFINNIRNYEQNK